jgi:hypothetical protein
MYILFKTVPLRGVIEFDSQENAVPVPRHRKILPQKIKNLLDV